MRNVFYAFVLALFALSLTGCSFLGHRISDEQAEQLAQGKADVEASRLVEVEDPAAAALLRQAAAARLMAAIANFTALPAPMTPVALLVDTATNKPIPEAIEAEHKAADAAEVDPPVGQTGKLLAGIAGIGLTALLILRTSPGAFGLFADLAYKIAAPLASKEARKVEKKAVVIAENAVAYGAALTKTAREAGLGEQVNEIQVAAGQVQDSLGIREQTKAILAAFKKSPTLPSPSVA